MVFWAGFCNMAESLLQMKKKLLRKKEKLKFYVEVEKSDDAMMIIMTVIKYISNAGILFNSVMPYLSHLLHIRC